MLNVYLDMNICLKSLNYVTKSNIKTTIDDIHLKEWEVAKVAYLFY